MNLGNDRWHTFAVEVTRSHISWFVDAHVVSTERRSQALSGVPSTVRFAMVGEPGKRMNVSRMQMDWLRYHTLRKPNRKSIAAPAPTAGRTHAACSTSPAKRRDHPRMVPMDPARAPHPPRASRPPRNRERRDELCRPAVAEADPTFYRSAAQAVAAPTEQLAYVVAFDRSGERPDALAVIDVHQSSDGFAMVVAGSTN